MPPALAEILVDDATWEAASRERRHEWRLALDELISDHRFDGPGDVKLRILVTVDGASRITLDVQTVDGHEYARVELPIEALAPHLKDYLDICRDMGKLGEGENSPRLEALDIAKRIAHDEAAEAVQALCGALKPDHATARRIFTLIVALHFDTTRLLLPHHRYAAAVAKR